MEVGLLLSAAALLSLERICYVWIWRAPDAFRVMCPGEEEPVAAVRFLFSGFKVLQLTVFVWWCYVHGNGSIWPPDGGPIVVGLGGLFIAAGQWLNLSVFYHLGTVGVFYGNRFGHEVPWCRQFPFSLLAHPQYVGTVLSIWGFFLIMRFPHGDWYVIPALETVYYVLGARLEQ
ncbi:MAG: hypothetical protein GEU99_06085 [Luteitalea sp.]|nr:hypothetical protein [Luteitalea sp.]